MCACERITASISSIGIGKRKFFSLLSLRLPWYIPQSSRMVFPLARRMWQEPVTSRAAP